MSSKDKPAKRSKGNPANKAAAEKAAAESGAREKPMAIYHVMREDEGFVTTAGILFQLVRGTAIQYPGKPRALYLDIDGHRNEAGGYDTDAYEIQKEFTLGYLSRWLAEIHIPLMAGSYVRPPVQHEDVPDQLTITGAAVPGTEGLAQPSGAPGEKVESRLVDEPPEGSPFFLSIEQEGELEWADCKRCGHRITSLTGSRWWFHCDANGAPLPKARGCRSASLARDGAYNDAYDRRWRAEPQAGTIARDGKGEEA